MASDMIISACGVLEVLSAVFDVFPNFSFSVEGRF